MSLENEIAQARKRASLGDGRGSARIRTGGGGFAIHCLSRLATEPHKTLLALIGDFDFVLEIRAFLMFLQLPTSS